MTPLLHPWTPTCDAPDQSVFERLVKSYYHLKFWASNLKIEWVMAILVHGPSFYTPETPTCDAPDQSVFEHLVKSYYHAKFRASRLIIDQVMAI